MAVACAAGWQYTRLTSYLSTTYCRGEWEGWPACHLQSHRMAVLP